MTYNIGMSELPILCPACYEESMVDMENLDRKPIDKITTELGFYCPKCEHWVKVSLTTLSLDTALAKLAKQSPEQCGYHFHFAKTLKKAEGVQERYGAF